MDALLLNVKVMKKIESRYQCFVIKMEDDTKNYKDAEGIFRRNTRIIHSN